MATDLFEADGTWRKGQIIMDNVQVYNCSQKDTYKAAVRFEGTLGGHSRVSNCAVHNGLDWGISLENANNIQLINNTFVGYRAVGMQMDKIRNVTVTGNFIGDVFGRNIDFLNNSIDKEACVAYSSYHSNAKGSPSYEVTFTDNIAAGCMFAGFVAPGHECGDDEQQSFRNNVAHSSAGYGAYLYPNPAHKTTKKCFEISHFAAYKNKEPCVVTFLNTEEHRAHDLTCIDNEKGISLNTAEMERDEVLISLSDSYIFGQTESEDCP